MAAENPLIQAIATTCMIAKNITQPTHVFGGCDTLNAIINHFYEMFGSFGK